MDFRKLYYRARMKFLAPPEEAGPLTRYMHYSWHRRMGPCGRMLFLVLLVFGPASAAITINFPLYLFSVMIFSFLLVARLAGVILFPKVKLFRSLPERCAAGATVQVRTELENVGMCGGYDLAIGENNSHSSVLWDRDPEYLEYLEPGGRAELSYNITPTKRGVYDFPGPMVMSLFPFGIYHAIKAFDQPHRLIVYPRFTPLSAVDLPVGRKHQPGGLQMVSHVGDSEEFLGNREFRPGDRLRDIHYASWARTGFPVIREFQQEYLCRIAMIVDTFIGRYDPKAMDALEAALSLSAAIADVLSRREYVIDIFAAGPDLYHFQAGRSLAYLDNILDILACVEGTDNNPFITLAPAIAEEISAISTVVMVLLDWDEVRERFVRSLRNFGVVVKVIIVREGPPSFDPSGFSSDAGPVRVLTPEQARTGTERI